ncbi:MULTISPECIES: DNA-3-methyladenine glycosylase family protein [unclassified Paraflavitalea]|uniref:DNA-3-methyladenine glycosylase family protein n=1 Tax=unclassified Paraflavitalea TaxID=2798305 RepID=UPI003D331512
MAHPYIEHLSKDKKLQKIIAVQGELSIRKRSDLCTYLCASIMSQQLSVKAADTIYNRFLDLFEKRKPTAELILQTTHEQLRAVGLSNAKAQYVRNVAGFHIEKGMDAKKLDKMTNEEVIGYLTDIKGVGRWTVEMLLMFALGREDVFAVDDLGIQQAMTQLYKLDATDKKVLKEAMIRKSKQWAPYRTYACMYLWRWKDS